MHGSRGADATSMQGLKPSLIEGISISLQWKCVSAVFHVLWEDEP